MVPQVNLYETWLARGSSPVDWCEQNYVLTSSIAEFTNTCSSIPLVAIPLSCLFAGVWNSYTRLVSGGPYLQMFLMPLVGVSSIYVHSTLSLLGQLFDEISIVWTLFMGYSFLMPNQHRPSFYFGKEAHLISVCVSGALTCAWFVFPYLNGFVLMSLSLPVLWMHFREIMIHKTPATLRLTKITFIVLTVGLVAWFTDIFLCRVCQRFYIPGMHSLWHLMVSFGAYLTITLFAYRKAVADVPTVTTTIRYLAGYWWGIPYVHCEKEDILMTPT